VLELSLVGDKGQYPHSTAQGNMVYRLSTEAVDSRFNGVVNISWMLLEQDSRLFDSSSQLISLGSDPNDKAGTKR
jgi:hypothetical protein